MKNIVFILVLATMLSSSIALVIYGNKSARIIGLILLSLITIYLIYLALKLEGD